MGERFSRVGALLSHVAAMTTYLCVVLALGSPVPDPIRCFFCTALPSRQ